MTIGKIVKLSTLISKFGWGLAQIDILVRAKQIELVRKNGRTCYRLLKGVGLNY